MSATMSSAQVFISYRRDDGAGYARAIAAELGQRFGGDRVFMDVDDIGAGQGFAEVIRQAVGGASVLLVLIGRRWRGEREGQGARIDDPDDFVRLEVAAGLRRGMRVIPVLLDGAAMPSAADLPDEIRALCGLQALELGNTRFAADIDRLAAALAQTLGASPRPVNTGRRLAIAAVLAGVVVLGVGAWLHFTARPDINGEWQAELCYEWESTPRVEHFRFSGERHEVTGTVTFLGVPRGVLDGEADRLGLRFSTRTAEMGGGMQAHSYMARLGPDGKLHFVMMTLAGQGSSAPIEFVARRVADDVPR